MVRRRKTYVIEDEKSFIPRLFSVWAQLVLKVVQKSHFSWNTWYCQNLILMIHLSSWKTLLQLNWHLESVQKKSRQTYLSAMTTIFNVEKCDAYRWKADKILVSTVCVTVLYLIWLRSKVQTRLKQIFSKVQNFWPFFC